MAEAELAFLTAAQVSAGGGPNRAEPNLEEAAARFRIGTVSCRLSRSTTPPVETQEADRHRATLSQVNSFRFLTIRRNRAQKVSRTLGLRVRRHTSTEWAFDEPNHSRVT